MLQLAHVRENVPAALVSLAFQEKLVYFVRHGQSLANTVPEAGKFDPALRDCALTPLGREQAAALRSVVPLWNSQIVVVSPLKRALQTACIAFADGPLVPMVSWPIVTEFYGEYPECQGRAVEVLRQDPDLLALPNFPGVSLDNVGPEWWTVANNHGRLETFLKWLQTCPETRIAVVAHWGFIHHFLNMARCPAHLELKNCCFVETVWRVGPLPAHMEHAREYALWLTPRSAHKTLLELEAFMGDCRNHPVLSASTLVTKARGQLHIALTEFAPLSVTELGPLVEQLQAVVKSLLIARGSAWTVSPCTFSLSLDDAHHTVWLRLGLDSSFLRTLGAQVQQLPGLGRAARVDGFGMTLLVDDRESGCVPLQAFYAVATDRHPLVKLLIDVARAVPGAPPVGDVLAGLVELKWDLALVSRSSVTETDIMFEPAFNMPLI